MYVIFFTPCVEYIFSTQGCTRKNNVEATNISLKSKQNPTNCINSNKNAHKRSISIELSSRWPNNPLPSARRPAHKEYPY